MKILTRISNDLDAAAHDNLVRVLRAPQGHDFSSNDYFCLAHDARIKAAVKQGLDEYGFGSTSSRYIRGERPLHALLESELARFKGTERALLFNSGYMANIGVIASMIKKGDVVYSDQLNHASLVDGLRLSGADIKIYPHLDYDFLWRALKNQASDKQAFIVTESLFSMDGDIAPLERYAELVKQFDCGLIVDEAHAVGLFGRNGRGLVDQCRVDDAVLVSINGLGKAFACTGAFVAGSGLVIDYLVQKARTLMFTTALPPAFLYAIKAALEIISDDDQLRNILHTRVGYFARLLADAKLIKMPELPTPIFPIIVGDNAKALALAHYAQSHGFDIRAIRPPTVPQGQARVRITVNCGHSLAQLEQCVGLLKEYL